MKVFIFCLLLAVAVAEQVKEYPHLIVRIIPKSTTQVNHLQEAIRQGQFDAPSTPYIITPLSVGKSAYVIVPTQAFESFENLVKRRHINYKKIDSTNIRSLTVDNSMHFPHVYPFSGEQGYVIESPRVTNWGVFGNWSNCPSGSYVRGMRLRTEAEQGNGDDTALNAIVLLCSVKGTTKYSEIHSLEGAWGTWGRTSYCPYDSAVKGFQLRSEEPQGSGDDTAANNLRLICDVTENNVVEGDGTSFGSWTERQECPPGQSVCGFRTQVEPAQGKGDDTALNNVDMECCSNKASTQYQAAPQAYQYQYRQQYQQQNQQQYQQQNQQQYQQKYQQQQPYQMGSTEDQPDNE